MSDTWCINAPCAIYLDRHEEKEYIYPFTNGFPNCQRTVASEKQKNATRNSSAIHKNVMVSYYREQTRPEYALVFFCGEYHTVRDSVKTQC